MPYGTKIATCCYCGTRAALVFNGKNRHELSCSSCGAPLHDMKMLRADAVQTPGATPVGQANRPVSRQQAVESPSGWSRKSERFGKKKKKKRKTLAKRFFEEAFDVIEDIFD